MEKVRELRLAGGFARSEFARALKSARALALALAACVLPLLASARAAAQSRHAPVPEQQRQQARTPFDDDDDAVDAQTGGESKEAPRATDPAAILRRARFVYVTSGSAFVSAQEIEDSLRKRKEFHAWGMTVTRSEAQADLIIEITRKPLTRRFTFSVIDPRTLHVVTSGKTRSVIFGKKISNKIAEKFANRVKVYRPYP